MKQNTILSFNFGIAYGIIHFIFNYHQHTEMKICKGSIISVKEPVNELIPEVYCCCLINLAKKLYILIYTKIFQ